MSKGKKMKARGRRRANIEREDERNSSGADWTIRHGFTGVSASGLPPVKVKKDLNVAAGVENVSDRFFRQ